jgi:hypothetical protein
MRRCFPVLLGVYSVFLDSSRELVDFLSQHSWKPGSCGDFFPIFFQAMFPMLYVVKFVCLLEAESFISPCEFQCPLPNIHRNFAQINHICAMH